MCKTIKATYSGSIFCKNVKFYYDTFSAFMSFCMSSGDFGQCIDFNVSELQQNNNEVYFDFKFNFHCDRYMDQLKQLNKLFVDKRINLINEQLLKINEDE